MNVSYKRSLYTMFLFGFLFLFISIFFFVVGPVDFLNDRLPKVITAVVIGLVLIAFGIMMLFTKKQSNIIDERDMVIQRKSSSVGLMLTAMYVFLLTIILFVLNRDNGVINISWVWFIAYSTFSFAYFITSFINVYLYTYED